MSSGNVKMWLHHAPGSLLKCHGAWLELVSDSTWRRLSYDDLVIFIGVYLDATACYHYLVLTRFGVGEIYACDATSV